MIEVRRNHIDQIIAHARRESPLEACGLLAGTEDTVRQVYRMANAERSEEAYRLDPEEQYRVFTEIEAKGWEVIGIYHSHPAIAAYPSQRDIDMAYDPQVFYVIVSLVEDDRPDLRAFHIRDGEITEVQISVKPD